MDDTISRAGAINEIARWIGYLDDDMIGRIQLGLKRLPSAQPPILTCDGCKHVGTYDTDFPCSRCIRREKDYYAQE